MRNVPAGESPALVVYEEEGGSPRKDGPRAVISGYEFDGPRESAHIFYRICKHFNLL